MPELKLARLPDRTPIKVTVGLLPDLHNRLEAYARAYAETYGVAEPVADLIPAMLTLFLDGDREFTRAERSAGQTRK
jgi:hypothetical protein